MATYPNKIRALGICIGASTVSAAQVEQKISEQERIRSRTESKPIITGHAIQSHEGNLRNTLAMILKKFSLNSLDKIAVTGRKFREMLNLSSITEPEAVEYAYQFVKPPGIRSPAIVSAGGETFLVYVLNQRGQISKVITDNKCASGTGEFFLQQLRRMNVTLEEASRWASEAEPYPISGRCSVFCKSDCTHATNKGVPRSRVTAGLCRMMGNKILELTKQVEKRNIMIVGGTVRNRMMIDYLNQKIPGLIVPEPGPYFEALGAALWALEQETLPNGEKFRGSASPGHSFSKHPPLKNFEHLVKFKNLNPGKIQSGDRCILGLDVGSTTTKAVLLRIPDNAILASVYLRTSGDPVGASRKCYSRILSQIKKKLDPNKISICGLGVCGSGRQIAGLHALTDGVINEIIAHATAAIYFDPQVDTIFEIGGQDAKYTHIIRSVPADYAMNEACSAGTGSFLEESAWETLGVKMEAIGDMAVKASAPPNFHDQCAAFIASDIKNAIHEGIGLEDILAGLVYSICLNYINRVKGNRPVGQKIFLQGGVCYNRAVPLAMAALLEKPIAVPPEPGLMGAFGVALEVKNRIASGLLKPGLFDLESLKNRQVKYRKPFICKGGKEKCDRHCEIAVIELEEKKFPFGGACNRYYNIRHQNPCNTEILDLVQFRQRMVFPGPGKGKTLDSENKNRAGVGINRSFLVNTYYPLYSVFFQELGFEVVIPEKPDQDGIDQKNAALCYPAELSHGFFYSLIKTEPPPEFLFMPHFKSIPGQNGHTGSQVCPFVQGERFYLLTAFGKKFPRLKEPGFRILSPLLDLAQGLDAARKPLVEMAVGMGINPKKAKQSFAIALEHQRECLAEIKTTGKKVLDELKKDPSRIAVVIFARSYNGFAPEAHMGIPHKLASRGVLTLPYDFLPFEAESLKPGMYWGLGQQILKAAELVKKHDQLFGLYITNFSCGPDSFIIGYFRDILGQKPSLTLELDSHTADAGLETRIEAFLDIVKNYRKLKASHQISISESSFLPARVTKNDGIPAVFLQSGEKIPLTHPRVTLLFPSMGEVGTPLLASVFRRMGIQAQAHPPAGEGELKLGRGNTTGKECLPLILTAGTLLHYVRHEKKDNEILVYFMATGSGPCRFGQYSVFLEDLIKRKRLPGVAILTLTSENSYLGIHRRIQRLAWWAIMISDILEDVRSLILANARDIESGMAIFYQEWENIRLELERGSIRDLKKQLERSAEKFSHIPQKLPPDQVPAILLAGEIFVRRDPLSRQFITEYLAEKGFATICSPVSEWLHYCNFLVEKKLEIPPLSLMERIKVKLKQIYMSRVEKTIKTLLSSSNLSHAELIDIKRVIRHAEPHMSINLTGEAILTVGSSIYESGIHACGAIAIGPFGCMPNRLSEAILNRTMNREVRMSAEPTNSRLKKILSDIDDIPFLSIESDGSPFPQLIQSKLETFCLQARRLHQKMISCTEK